MIGKDVNPLSDSTVRSDLEAVERFVVRMVERGGGIAHPAMYVTAERISFSIGLSSPISIST